MHGLLDEAVQKSVWARAARVAAAAIVAAWMTVGLVPGTAAAHALDTLGFSEISPRGEDVRYELVVDYGALAAVAGFGASGETALADAERRLAAGRADVASYLGRRLAVLVDGVTCAQRITTTGIERRFDQPYARMVLDFDCPGEGAYEIRYSVLAGDMDPGHRNVVRYRLGDESGRYVFDSAHTTLSVGEGSAPRQSARFTALGFEHILGGLDHLLFLVALVIGARGVRDLLGVVTVFTLAHSVTLALAAARLVAVPATIVEPLVALSIAYVAAENLVGRQDTRFRLAAVFGFGLLHGLGFAGALDLTDDVTESWVVALLSFTVGIELGQALVVALVFPLVLLSRRFTWSRHAQFAAAAGIALCGLAWFTERLLFA